jgi:hypothetical protein
VDRTGPRWTADIGRGGASLACGARALELTGVTGDGGGGRAGRGGAREVLTGDGGVATRRSTGGDERRRLELVASAEEGAKELRRVRMRCGEGRVVSSPFYRGRGVSERGGRGGSNDGINGFNAIEEGGEVKRGLRGGDDGGVSNGSGGIRG